MKDTAATADQQENSGVWIDSLGRRAGEVYYDRLGHRRVVTAPTSIADDGSVVATGADAITAMTADIGAQQAKRQAALRRMPPDARRQYATYLRTRHAPRETAERSNDRVRGSRRKSSSASSSSSSSSDDPPPGNTEPPSTGGRLCGCGCGGSLDGRNRDALHATETCRKRMQRRRDRANPQRFVARRLGRLAAAERLREETGRLTAEDLPPGCRCGGEGFDRDPEGALICVSCGRALEPGIASVNGYDKRLAAVRELMRNDRAQGRLAHRQRRHREWKTRPNRKLAAKLRNTRVDRKAAA